MAETEHITVAETSGGPGAKGLTGKAVDLPVVELLTGRGFVTGKSGSGKSNTASVVAEKLLDSGFGLLIVDIDGEYYGLKEEYEILHAGADDECDIQVSTDHAEKLAALALEQNVPIILDVSSFLDEDEAKEVLTAVARQLFAKAKKQKQPFLLLVEEVHEYIPENGAVDECGKMLIKIGKRGRKHGLGICGISQRPADVKKDFITQCDWLCWHRLTWNNDTKVVRRVLDGEYADAVEDLDDGEGFLVTDWADQVQRVQFFRKQTFDAGATPGLDDFERPELKSVSDELVEELSAVGEASESRDDHIQSLKEELDEKNSRIAELERELQDARDMRNVAEQFTDALLEHVEGAAPGRTEQERMRRRHADDTGSDSQTENQAAENTAGSEADASETDSLLAPAAGDGSAAGSESDTDDSTADDDAMDAFGAMMDVAATENGDASADDSDEADADDGMDLSGLAGIDTVEADSSAESDDASDDSKPDFGTPGTPSPPDMTAEVRSFVSEPGDVLGGPSVGADDPDAAGRPDVVGRIRAALADLSPDALSMLAYYREHGADRPQDALAATSGSMDRTRAFALNRELRQRGLIDHVGRGFYEYRIDTVVHEAASDRPERARAAYVREIETEYLQD